MFNKFSKCASAMLVAGAAAVFAMSASADIILAFGQQGQTNVVTGTATTTNCSAQATCTTTIVITDALVFVTSYAGTTAPPFAAYLDFTATSTDFASVSGGTLLEHFTGTFSLCSTAIGCTDDYLSGSFIDALSGNIGTPGLSLSAGTPPSGNVVFASDEIAPANLDLQRAISFSFSNIGPPGVQACGSPGQTLCNFTASVSGNMSANTIRHDVPEPMTLALVGLALAGLGFTRRRLS